MPTNRVFLELFDPWGLSGMGVPVPSVTGPKWAAERKVREWECQRCGASLDRDVNAAINVLMEGEAIATSFVSHHN